MTTCPAAGDVHCWHDGEHDIIHTGRIPESWTLSSHCYPGTVERIPARWVPMDTYRCLTHGQDLAVAAPVDLTAAA